MGLGEKGSPLLWYVFPAQKCFRRVLFLSFLFASPSGQLLF